MADASGTPSTNFTISKLNTSVDPPSGRGLNTIVDDIDTLLAKGFVVMSAKGDIVYSSAANVAARLPIGSDGDVLTVASGVPSWAAPAGGGTTFGTTLPASPSDGDQYILTDSTSAPTYAWLLQYSSSASKWIFIGGSSWLKNYASGGVINTLGVQPVATWYTDSGTVYTIPRTGTYHVRWAADINRNGGGNGAAQSAVYKNTALVSNTANAKIENLYNNNDTMSGEWAITANAGDTVGVVVSGAAVGTWVLAWKTVEITPVTVT